MEDFEIEEGGICPSCKNGHTFFPKVENCSCHLFPPCGECENNMLECDNCFLNHDEIYEEIRYGRL